MHLLWAQFAARCSWAPEEANARPGPLPWSWQHAWESQTRKSSHAQRWAEAEGADSGSREGGPEHRNPPGQVRRKRTVAR